MFSRLFMQWILWLVSFSVLSLVAQDLAAGELGGYIYLGLVVDRNTESSQTHISSLEKDLATDTDLSPGVYFKLNYSEAGSPNSWFIQNQDLEVIEAGRTQQTTVGLFDLKAFYALPDSVWENPYETASKRHATDLNEFGGAVSYQPFSAASIDYTYTRITLAKDTTASLPHLGREGSEHQVSLSYDMVRWTLGGQLSVLNTKGDADSNQGIGVFVAHTQSFSDAFILQLNAEATEYFYDAEHPLFDKTREDIYYKVQSVFKARLGNVLTGICFLEYSRTNSNIDFLDEREVVFALGLGRDF